MHTGQYIPLAVHLHTKLGVLPDHDITHEVIVSVDLNSSGIEERGVRRLLRAATIERQALSVLANEPALMDQRLGALVDLDSYSREALEIHSRPDRYPHAVRQLEQSAI